MALGGPNWVNPAPIGNPSLSDQPLDTGDTQHTDPIKFIMDLLNQRLQAQPPQAKPRSKGRKFMDYLDASAGMNRHPELAQHWLNERRGINDQESAAYQNSQAQIPYLIRALSGLEGRQMMQEGINSRTPDIMHGGNIPSFGPNGVTLNRIPMYDRNTGQLIGFQEAGVAPPQSAVVDMGNGTQGWAPKPGSAWNPAPVSGVPQPPPMPTTQPTGPPPYGGFRQPQNNQAGAARGATPSTHSGSPFNLPPKTPAAGIGAKTAERSGFANGITNLLDLQMVANKEQVGNFGKPGWSPSGLLGLGAQNAVDWMARSPTIQPLTQNDSNRATYNYNVNMQPQLFAYTKAQTGAQFSAQEFTRYQSAFPTSMDDEYAATEKIGALLKMVRQEVIATDKQYNGIEVDERFTKYEGRVMPRVKYKQLAPEDRISFVAGGGKVIE